MPDETKFPLSSQRSVASHIHNKAAESGESKNISFTRETSWLKKKRWECMLSAKFAKIKVQNFKITSKYSLFKTTWKAWGTVDSEHRTSLFLIIWMYQIIKIDMKIGYILGTF